MPRRIEVNSSLSEEERLRMLLTRADALRETPNLELKADWLLSGELGSSLWKTKNGGKEYLVGTEWRNTLNVSFDIVLPDNTNLLDEKNKRFLNLIQHWSFFLRQGIFSPLVGPETWQSHVYSALRFVQWLVKHDALFLSREFGFELLSQDAITELFGDLAKGSWSEALDVRGTIISGLISMAGLDYSSTEDMDVYNLKSEIVEKICPIIEASGGYKTVIRPAGLKLVSRAWLAKKFNIPYDLLRNYDASAVLRQFEPTYQHPHLLMTRPKHRLYPSQNCPLLKDCINRPTSNETYTDNVSRLSFFLETAKRFPAYAGIIPELDIPAASAEFEKQTRARTHHNLMPIGTGLYLLDQAFNWIINYGKYIAEITINFTKWSYEYQVSAQRMKDSKETRAKKLHCALQDCCAKSATLYPEAHNALLITTINKQYRKANAPLSLKAALQSLVGACAYIIAGLKPSRYTEIQSLDRNCIIPISLHNKREVNYWIWYELGKSGVLGHNDKASAPLPEIAVKAIELLQYMGKSFAQIFHDDSDSAERLFYLPIRLNWAQPSNGGHVQTLDTLLDRFCDAARSPIDEYGRRWYARVHELRKLFLITLFWHGKHLNLDAARFAAGHENIRHTIEYVEADIAGAEISKIEAEYVDDRLIKLETDRVNRDHNPGLCMLYQKVCDNFGVDHLESVPEKQYFEYLIQLKKSGAYDIKPILVTTSDQVTQFEIAIIYGEVYDEIYSQSN
jgi:hypothetical protein